MLFCLPFKHLDDVEFSYILLKVEDLESKETNEEGGEVSLVLNKLFWASVIFFLFTT